MPGDESYFDRALRDFTFDVACGAAIRHLDELGYGPEEIVKKLDFPVSEQRIREYLAKRAADRTDADADGSEYEIILEYDEYGRSSYRRVKKEDPSNTP
ncbi:MAG: hypothetical protein K6E68_01935 [Lachnospiraceae bacterium]|nr:hypothetical protein [Lachnospiraceae bacterium]